MKKNLSKVCEVGFGVFLVGLALGWVGYSLATVWQGTHSWGWAAVALLVCGGLLSGAPPFVLRVFDVLDGAGRRNPVAKVGGLAALLAFTCFLHAPFSEAQQLEYAKKWQPTYHPMTWMGYEVGFAAILVLLALLCSTKPALRLGAPIQRWLTRRSLSVIDWLKVQRALLAARPDVSIDEVIEIESQIAALEMKSEGHYRVAAAAEKDEKLSYELAAVAVLFAEADPSLQFLPKEERRILTSDNGRGNTSWRTF